MRRGFTVVELLVALAILGLLAALVIPNYLEWRNTERIRDAQKLIAAQLLKARADAQHLGTPQTLTWTSDTVAGAALPAGVTITSASDTLTLEPSHGTALHGAEPLDLVVIDLAGPGGKTSSVNVVGIMAKAIPQAID